jgi:hypothetical protein
VSGFDTGLSFDYGRFPQSETLDKAHCEQADIRLDGVISMVVQTIKISIEPGIPKLWNLRSEWRFLVPLNKNPQVSIGRKLPQMNAANLEIC